MDRIRPKYFDARKMDWRLYTPKLLTVLREGYSFTDFRHDAIAGLTVAIVALPLAMALAIASGAGPDAGLVTAIIAGFLISVLGGSRYQIGGPTGAFVVVVFAVIQKHGYDGLVLATLMAGLMLIVAGFARLGTWIKYIPDPVVTGFTAGIAIIIFSSQIKDLLGLSMGEVPAEFVEKWQAFWEARHSINWFAVATAFTSLAVIVGLRRKFPKAPGFLIVIVAGSLIALALGLPIETIGSRFGDLPSGLPGITIPEVTLERLKDLLPSAFTIAFLAGVESLLSAVVADGMTGGRHRSNCELVAQGVANSASALFGGLPATGAIARTATNVRSGARSPVAGALHAVFLLIFLLVAAPLAKYIPLSCLAAILVIVAWNMSEIERIRQLMKGPIGDRVVLVLTLVLTVAVDLTYAIEVGVVLAAILFMHRMSEVVAIGTGGQNVIQADVADSEVQPHADSTKRADLPAGVEVIELHGPLFFGVVSRVASVLDRITSRVRVFILRLEDVPMMDASGANKLADFVEQCERQGKILILVGLQPQPRLVLRSMHVLSHKDTVHHFRHYSEALKFAITYLGEQKAKGELSAAESN